MQVMAEVMGAEAAIVRTQFVSGTHAIATALYSVLRPGDRMLAVAGRCCLCSLQSSDQLLRLLDTPELLEAMLEASSCACINSIYHTTMHL